MDTQVMVRESSLPVAIATTLQWAERRRAFNEWVNTQLKDGVDYGKVPGTDKKTLLKPGAEKVTQYFGTAPMVEVTHREQNLENGYLYLEVKVSLVSIQTGQIVGTPENCLRLLEQFYQLNYLFTVKLR